MRMRTRPRWLLLLRPRWLAWHASIMVATAGMLWLGDWQLHRAESGNELSWAYTFEWPLFAIFAVYFWIKSLRDELKPATAGEGVGASASDASAAQTTDGNALATDSAVTSVAADEAYLARLKSEVSGHGKWHGWR